MVEPNFFGPKKPIDGLAVVWKTLAGFLLAVVAIMVAFLFHRLQLPKELQEASLVFEKIENVSDQEVYAGGDAVVAPIEPIKRQCRN